MNRLVTAVSYGGPAPIPGAISYGYDAAGNRASMTDETGSVTYQYDQLSRLQSETRQFAGISGNFTLSYEYNLAGALKAITDPKVRDSTLDRSYQYDQVGALVIAHSGAEARASAITGQWGTMDGPYSHGYDYDKFGNLTHRYGWGGEVQGGAPGQSSDLYYTYSNNKNQRDGFTYDPAGNLTNDVAQTYSYDATGQQRSASSNTYLIQQGYDGDGLRGQKIENGVTTWYVRSSVLGGQVVAEMDGSGNWSRGYVYAGGELLAVQQSNSVNWVHEDSVTKSKRITDIYGNIVSTVELDPWGADTNRSSNSAFQPQNFTGYIRDGNGGQDAMARRYSASGRFSQPDPYGGSYDFSDPQSLNRYAYTKNDPVNFRDPSGLGIMSILRTIGRWLNRESSGSGGGPGPILSGDNGLLLEEGGDEGGDVGTGPQNSAAGSSAAGKGTKESKECAEYRARLMNDAQSRAILDDAFKRSQFGTPNVHEEGGLLGEAIDYGQPYQKDRRIDARFTNPPNLAPTTLGTTFSPWAKSQIGKDYGAVNYTYWYHTHPFTEGDVVQGLVVRNPNHPSLIDGDADVSQQLALTGVVVSKKRIVVFGMFGEKCSFRR